ncbi:arginine decarboxylase [Kouleothrix sp.]|uniref:arginine decarboxylase n=1 Tax=Kouleothrix sp. TaxID=2779161 RepID=UPI00391A6508
MSKQSYLDYIQNRYGIESEGMLTDFLSRRDGRLLLADRIDLSAMAERYGAPLEIAYCPLITTQVERMLGWAAGARAESGYEGEFLYAYATKANFAEEVVRTALAAGAHYETSATADVLIAHHLWRQGVLPDTRYLFCNGSKEASYVDAIVALREAGYARVVPILDDLAELDAYLARCTEPLLLGVRERHFADVVNPAHPGGERFGLTQDEIAEVARRLAGTPHQLVVYHAMVGSQLEDMDGWMARLERSAAAYCRLRQQVPTLRAFNFGGGMPTSAYALGFAFDYPAFLRRLMASLATVCAEHGVPQPDIIGEFGRYTVANHSVYLFEVGAVKAAQASQAEPWYLVNGSMMVSLPDTLIVEDQQFIVLPLERWDAEARGVRLGGRRTCDSDDMFPRPSQPPLMLPDAGAGLTVAVFGVGAYQQMISGRGGAHHCLNPEMRRIIIEQDDDALVVREVAPQNLGAIMSLLGYATEQLEPVARPMPAVRPEPVRANRRRQLAPRPRSLVARAGRASAPAA